ncbi:hypothetical protein Acr_00g0043030 [Actinidia rufa]|uniref:Uncharacterized protein n=1 Tax=Actinidia rufa TaxID=165716 RepID=A0A7J0DK99_9ERIC|nr:hypothetical protein Acr_00g0043030 [Actinidia rufa]
MDCDDQGAYYVEAHVKSPLFDFLKRPQVSMIRRLCPSEISWSESSTGFHGTATSNFLKSWAATAWGFERPCPSYIAPSIFPQNDAFPKELNILGLISPFIETGKSVTRRFAFDSSAIAMLWSEPYLHSGRDYSHLETLHGYLCSKIGFQKATSMLHRRASPPFPESCAVKEAICKSGNFVKQLEGDEGFIKLCESLKGIRQELDDKEPDLLGFASWLG